MDPIQGAREATTWNVGKYGMEMASQGRNQGIEAMMQTKGIAEIVVKQINGRIHVSDVQALVFITLSTRILDWHFA